MSKPTVCAILLTADRPEFARRAVESFRRQTYPAKRLLVYDTGAEDVEMDWLGDEEDSRHQDIEVLESAGVDHHGERKTIGYLRNRANAAAAERDASILIHFDDDDWSHPNRIAEQVALLQSSGADCVGYREMLFWAGQRAQIEIDPSRCGPDGAGVLGIVKSVGEAWLYSNRNPGYALGTSLCYWRKTWERKPFTATSRGEDLQFITGLKCVGVPSTFRWMGPSCSGHEDLQPRMIARIHPGNTSDAYKPEALARASEWRRVPEWDSDARKVMES